MVLFEFDKIIKSKYKKYINETSSSINFEEFKKKCLLSISKIFYLYFTGISEDYINNILINDKVRISIICVNEKFSLQNIISIIIYHKTSSEDKIKYYMLAYGIHKKFRKCGYGKYSLDEFINWIKISTNNNKQKILLLKSVETSMSFYLSYGFVLTDLASNKLFYKYEPRDELKSNQDKILEYILYN
jgi:hypothetical protein